MGLRTAVLLLTVTLLALGAPDASANRTARKPVPKKETRRGATGGNEVRPARPGRAGGGASLSGTRTARPQRPAPRQAPAARPVRPGGSRVARAEQQQTQYQTPLHAARAAQRARPRRSWKRMALGGVAAVVGVGLAIVVGDALGLDEVVSRLFDGAGGGEQLNPFEQMPDPPEGWGEGGGGSGPAWPDWAPDKPGGDFEPPSWEDMRDQAEKILGKEPPAPTK